MTNINPFDFLFNLLYFLSYHKVIEHYDKIHKESSDYVINLIFTKLYIIRTPKCAKLILSKDSSQITYFNKSFFNSHGHKYGIGNLDFVDDYEMWNILHETLAKSIDLNQLDLILEKHKYILTSKYNYEYDIVKTCEDFTFHLWCDFCFNKSDENFVNKYISLRNKIINILGKTFYNDKLYLIPFLGPLICKIKYWIYCDKYSKIDLEIENLINNSDNGFIHKFKNQIKEHDKYQTMLIDNTFLSFLVFDFINIYVQKFLINFKNTKDLKTYQSETLSLSFLFPYRMRKISKNIVDSDIKFMKGDYVLIDLIKSNNLFSYGPRVCIGTGFVHKLTMFLEKIFRDYKIIHKSEKITYGTNIDVPSIIEPYYIKLTLPDDYLKNNLKSYDHKNLKFYKVEGITENPELFKYCIKNLCDRIILLDNNKKIDYIVTSESRGFIFASPVADRLNLPMICARKKGKLPGKTRSESYKKSYDTVEEIELSDDLDISGKNVIIIDDGIASGATTIALHKLVEKFDGNIVEVLTIIKHQYVHCDYDLSDVYSLFYL